MNCSRELLEGYLDEELDLGVRTEVEEHLAICRNCSDVYARILERQSNIRSLAREYEAPEELRRTVHTALIRAAADEDKSKRPSASWQWMAIAASVLLAFSLAWNIGQLRSRSPEREMLAESILSSHVRSLMGTHLMDVVSTDQHTVKPWFAGRLDFSPVVKDLAPQGFPLIGGRIEYLSGRSAAALIYQRRQHIINLFTWPVTTADGKESHLSRNGYNLVQWSQGPMTYWAVSDVSAPELEKFHEEWLK
jgi:anti-sigma factor RsiW